MTRKRTLTLLLWICTILWTALLFLFSGQSGDDSAGLSEALTRFVLRILPMLPLDFDTLHFFLRKAAHFSIFAVEGALLLSSLWRGLKGKTAARIAPPACLLIAGLNEFHQSFTAGRHASIADVGIDFAGAVCGMLILALGMRIYRKITP